MACNVRQVDSAHLYVKAYRKMFDSSARKHMRGNDVV